MNQLQVINRDGQLLVDSREVAEMIDVRHSDLLERIRGYVQHLTNGKFRPLDFFVSSTFKDAKGEYRPRYLLTKKGCEMVANKMTGEKGVLFTAAYVTKFEEMEKKLQQPPALTERQAIIQSLKLTAELAEEQEEIKRDVSMLKNTMRIDGAEEFQIKQKATRRVVESLGGKDAPAYQELNRKVFSRFWNEFKRHFLIPRYGDLPKSRFKEGLEFIEEWQPDTSTRIEINELNRQMTIKEVS